MGVESVQDQLGRKDCKTASSTTYHVAAVRVNHDAVAELAILPLDLDSVEATARPIVNLDQVSSKVGRRQTT